MKTCKTCRFAQWQRTAKGRVKTGDVGTCRWKPPEVIAVPKTIWASVRQRFNQVCQYGIWWDNETECDAWEPKD